MTASNFFNLALTFDLPILRNHEILTKDLKNTIASIVNIIFVTVVFFLYILCGFMIFTIGSQSIDCSGTLYHSTYWFITSTLGLIVILLFASIILYAYNRYRLAIVRGSTPRSQTVNTNNNLSATFASNGV